MKISTLDISNTLTFKAHLSFCTTCFGVSHNTKTRQLHIWMCVTRKLTTQVSLDVNKNAFNGHLQLSMLIFPNSLKCDRTIMVVIRIKKMSIFVTYGEDCIAIYLIISYWNQVSLCIFSLSAICREVVVTRVETVDILGNALCSQKYQRSLPAWIPILMYQNVNIIVYIWSPNQCSWKTFMVHQTFVWWALYILFKFVKSLVRHLGLAIGNVRHVRWFSWTLPNLAMCAITKIGSCTWLIKACCK